MVKMPGILQGQDRTETNSGQRIERKQLRHAEQKDNEKQSESENG